MNMLIIINLLKYYAGYKEQSILQQTCSDLYDNNIFYMNNLHKMNLTQTEIINICTYDTVLLYIREHPIDYDINDICCLAIELNKYYILYYFHDIGSMFNSNVLDCAAYVNDVELIQWLMARGHIKWKYAVIYLTETNNISTVEYIFEYYVAHELKITLCKDTLTLLVYHAVRTSNIDIVQYLYTHKLIQIERILNIGVYYGKYYTNVIIKWIACEQIPIDEHLVRYPLHRKVMLKYNFKLI